MATALIFMSNILRRTTIAVPRRHLSPRYSNTPKDFARTSVIASSSESNNSAVHSPDILLGMLKTASNANNVLDIVHRHASVMNVKHIMQALRSLFTLQKNGQSTMSTKQILKHADFELLCKNLKRTSGSIELNERIEALKVVCYVGVPSDSMIVQVLLQLIRHQINFLSLHQIIFLDFLFAQMKSTPVIEAVSMALPLIFEIQLPIKVDKDNIVQLAECLFFATKKSVSSNCIEYLINSIYNYKKTIDPKTTLSLIWSICELNSDSFFEPLLSKLIDNMIIDIDSYTYTDIETTLSKLTARFSPHCKFYYNDIFCDLVANRVMDNDLGHEPALFVYKKFTKLLHGNDELLNYLTNKLVQNPELFNKLDPIAAFVTIKALAVSDFRPRKWNELKAIIEESKLFDNTELRGINFIRLTISLCLLDIYKENLLKFIMHEGQLRKLINTGHKSELENVVQIKQAVSTFRPDLEHLLASESTFSKVASKIKFTDEFPLEGAVMHAFGGDKYVKTAVTSNLHHHIDHLIVLREGGFPVAFTERDSPKAIEDVVLPENAQMVAILASTSASFMANMKRLRSRTSLELRSLRHKGCIPIIISVDDWKNLAEFERIPYIMQLVKTKTSENELLQNANVY